MKIIFILIILSIATSVYIPYQAHSFNDFDYFIQLLKKGVTVFKLDISMVERQSCIAHSTWNHNQNACEFFSQYTQQICCLGFRGDASSTPVFNYDFNTTTQFLTLLQRSDLKVYLQQDIFIAINFQYSDAMNNMTKFFLYNMMKIITDKKLGVTIATGSDNIILSYDKKCVVQGLKCDQMEKYISDSNIVLQSSSYTPFHPYDAKKRYRNFNVYYKQITRFCEEGFPSWVDKYNYPLIFWQPSNQEHIQFVAQTFLSPTCKRPPLHNDISKFAIASNLQPEMFQNYFQNYLRNQGLGQKNLIQNSKNPLITTIKSDQQYLVFSYIDLTNNLNKLQIRNLDWKIIRQITLQNKIKFLKGNKDSFAILYENNTVAIHDSLFNALETYPLNEIPIAFTYYNNKVHYLKKLPGVDDYFNYVFRNAKSITVTGAPISFTPTDLQISDLIYAVGTKNNQNWISHNFTVQGKLSFGISPKIAISNYNIYVLYENGMCQSGAWMNNNQMNKCSFYKSPQFEALSSLPNMIGFIIGSQQDFLNNVQNKDPITACHKQILAGKLANGNTVTHTIANGNTVYTAYSYVRLSDQPLVTSLFCGGSNFENYKGQHIILSSFNVQGLKQNNKRLDIKQELQ